MGSGVLEASTVVARTSTTCSRSGFCRALAACFLGSRNLPRGSLFVSPQGIRSANDRHMRRESLAALLLGGMHMFAVLGCSEQVDDATGAHAVGGLHDSDDETDVVEERLSTYLSRNGSDDAVGGVLAARKDLLAGDTDSVHWASDTPAPKAKTVLVCARVQLAIILSLSSGGRCMSLENGRLYKLSMRRLSVEASRGIGVAVMSDYGLREQHYGDIEAFQGGTEPPKVAGKLGAAAFRSLLAITKKFPVGFDGIFAESENYGAFLFAGAKVGPIWDINSEELVVEGE